MIDKTRVKKFFVRLWGAIKLFVKYTITEYFLMFVAIVVMISFGKGNLNPSYYNLIFSFLFPIYIPTILWIKKKKPTYGKFQIITILGTLGIFGLYLVSFLDSLELLNDNINVKLYYYGLGIGVLLTLIVIWYRECWNNDELKREYNAEDIKKTPIEKKQKLEEQISEISEDIT